MMVDGMFKVRAKEDDGCSLRFGNGITAGNSAHQDFLLGIFLFANCCCVLRRKCNRKSTGGVHVFWRYTFCSVRNSQPAPLKLTCTLHAGGIAIDPLL